MIDVRELRIGNYTWWTKEGRQQNRHVRAITKNDFDNATFLDPIPLTTEILKASGFKETVTANYVTVDFSVYQLGNLEWVDSNSCYWRDECIHAEIKYVHQLQNLYFALTGTELEIKLNELQTV